jgi:hypothetical protein
VVETAAAVRGMVVMAVSVVLPKQKLSELEILDL